MAPDRGTRGGAENFKVLNNNAREWEGEPFHKKAKYNGRVWKTRRDNKRLYTKLAYKQSAAHLVTLSNRTGTLRLRFQTPARANRHIYTQPNASDPGMGKYLVEHVQPS